MCLAWGYPDGRQFLYFWPKLAAYGRLLLSDGLIVDSTGPHLEYVGIRNDTVAWPAYRGSITIVVVSVALQMDRFCSDLAPICRRKSSP